MDTSRLVSWALSTISGILIAISACTLTQARAEMDSMGSDISTQEVFNARLDERLKAIQKTVDEIKEEVSIINSRSES